MDVANKCVITVNADDDNVCVLQTRFMVVKREFSLYFLV